VVAVSFPDGREIYVPDHARAYWEVLVAGEGYVLDFAGRSELEVLARLLKDQHVVAAGTLAGGKLRLDSLKADLDNPRKDEASAVAVGKVRWRISHALTGETLAFCDALPDPFSRSWRAEPVLVVNGKVYTLDLKAPGMKARVEALAGTLARLTGTLRGGVLIVTGAQAGDGSWVRKTVQVEVYGTLGQRMPLRALAIWPSCPSRPLWVVHAEGKTYDLSFAGKAHLVIKARELNGRMVLLRGTLEGNVITVTSLELARPEVIPG
jgi:hypothetical protein